MSIIGRLVGVLGGSGFLHCLVGCIYTNTLYITFIVLFLTAFSTRVSLLSSKIHNGDDTPTDAQSLLTETLRVLETAVYLKHTWRVSS